jgi:RNA polymerase sporulation-specific sigma factor
LIALAKQGDRNAYERLVKRYHGFVRLKASSYFLAGGDSEDLIQEGLVGLYKAIRDFRFDRESSFRNFAELCITRQIITAVKTATRNKHTPLNQYVSFSSTPAGAGDDVPTLDQVLPGPTVHDPVNQVISSEELRSLVGCLSTALSELESRVLGLYLDGYSYEQVGERLECDTKTVDNALQRVKRKVGAHLRARGAPACPNPPPAPGDGARRRWALVHLGPAREPLPALYGLLVPGLDADLACDQPVVDLEHRGTENIGAVRIAASLGEGEAVVVAHGVTDCVSHVARAHVLDPCLDLPRTVQDAG